MIHVVLREVENVTMNTKIIMGIDGVTAVCENEWRDD